MTVNKLKRASYKTTHLIKGQVFKEDRFYFTVDRLTVLDVDSYHSFYNYLDVKQQEAQIKKQITQKGYINIISEY